MACESWNEKLYTYLDGEIPEQGMRDFDAHVRNCHSCAADALARVQIKRAIQVAGKRFAPSADFRQRVRQRVANQRNHNWNVGWMLAAATVVILAVAVFSTSYMEFRSNQERANADHVLSEIADLHVENLASSHP
jgi:predicted anti-sigma-YlaC factor YlaD